MRKEHFEKAWAAVEAVETECEGRTQFELEALWTRCSEKTIAPFYKGGKVSFVFFGLVCVVLCVLVWVVLFLSFGLDA